MVKVRPPVAFLYTYIYENQRIWNTINAVRLWGQGKYSLININIYIVLSHLITYVLLSLWILYVGEMAINQVKIWESVYALQTLISMSTACYFSTFSIWTFERQLHTGNWGFQYQIRLLISSYFETWILFQASFISFRNQLWEVQTGVSSILKLIFVLSPADLITQFSILLLWGLESSWTCLIDKEVQLKFHNVFLEIIEN